MKVGKSLESLRDRKGYTQENAAREMHVSKPMVSHLENERRTMTRDLARHSVSAFDDAQYGFEIAHETARDYITPLVTAEKAVELHRLALEEVFKREANQAIDKFNEVSLVKPPEYVDENEKEQIKQGIGDLLDVQAIMNSFLMRLEQEYDISVKSCMKQRMPVWKSKGWI